VLLKEAVEVTTTIGQLMTRDLVTIHPDETMARARRLMKTHGVQSLTVVEPPGLPVGLLTVRDLAMSVETGERLEVKHVMRRSTKRVRPSMLLSEAAHLMAKDGTHHLLVTEKGRLLGVFSVFDMIKLVTLKENAKGAAGHPPVSDPSPSREPALGFEFMSHSSR
jgi:CBS domain-containing protein